MVMYLHQAHLIKKIIPLIFFSITQLVHAQNSLPKDSNGWTLFTPSVDSRIVYVSESTGDDATGASYSANDSEIGDDPFTPGGVIQPFKTIAAAFGAVRAGYPDWVLLKRGDTWYESGQVKVGKSAEEPFLFGAYGTGTKRPLLKTGADGGINVCCKNTSYWAVAGISFYAHTRDKDSDEFTSHAGKTGFNVYTGEDYTASGILIEDCMFRWYRNNVIQGPGTLDDIVVRRNVITDNYDTSAHSQGLYTNNVSMLLEENVFDHNGWYQQSINADSDPSEGQATMFNHNTYFSQAHGVTFRGNIFLRASSIGNKWTANSRAENTPDITIENNLYVEGEIGISMGGNKAGPFRFKNIRIADNVMLDIGRGQPTNRTLGWGIDIQEWDSGTVSNNYLLHNTSTVVNNVYAINLCGGAGTRGVAITGNTIYGMTTGSSLFSVKDTVSGCTVSENSIQGSGSNGRLMNTGTYTGDGVLFSGNTYFSERAEAEWFTMPDGRGNLSSWSSFSGETGAKKERMEYPDPDRTVELYNAHLGNEGTFEAFIAEVRSQSKIKWQPEYTAAAINNWIRAGFGGNAVRYHPQNHVSHPSTVSAGTTRIYSINGKLVKTFNSSEKVPRFFTSGVYILRPERGAGKFTAATTIR